MAEPKRRTLKAIQPNTYFFEADEHGLEFVVLLPDGREYRFSGVLSTPCRDDMRRPQ
jgi:hypothetical protein